jgi:hypothetical protein
MSLRILDLSAGNRAMWFNREHPDATYVDIRPEVSPTVVADTRTLPSQIGGDYSLVVFDPSHENFGANAAMSKTYGHHTWDEIRDTVKRTAAEAWRVTRDDALMAFKWNDHGQKLGPILQLVNEYWEPLFANLTSSRRRTNIGGISATYWVMLRRRPEKYVPKIMQSE